MLLIHIGYFVLENQNEWWWWWSLPSIALLELAVDVAHGIHKTYLRNRHRQAFLMEVRRHIFKMEMTVGILAAVLVVCGIAMVNDVSHKSKNKEERLFCWFLFMLFEINLVRIHSTVVDIREDVFVSE